MDLKTVINTIGLGLTILGVWMVWKNSPENFHTITQTFDFDGENKRKTGLKNKLLKAGVYIVMLGTVLQMVSNFI